MIFHRDRGTLCFFQNPSAGITAVSFDKRSVSTYLKHLRESADENSAAFRPVFDLDTAFQQFRQPFCYHQAKSGGAIIRIISSLLCRRDSERFKKPGQLFRIYPYTGIMNLYCQQAVRLCHLHNDPSLFYIVLNGI